MFLMILVQDFTLLHWAAMNDRTSVIEALLDNGADIDATTSLDGFTALSVACFNSRWDAAKTLVSRGANVLKESKMVRI